MFLHVARKQLHGLRPTPQLHNFPRNNNLGFYLSLRDAIRRNNLKLAFGNPQTGLAASTTPKSYRPLGTSHYFPITRRQGTWLSCVTHLVNLYSVGVCYATYFYFLSILLVTLPANFSQSVQLHHVEVGFVAIGV